MTRTIARGTREPLLNASTCFYYTAAGWRCSDWSYPDWLQAQLVMLGASYTVTDEFDL